MPTTAESSSTLFGFMSLDKSSDTQKQTKTKAPKLDQHSEIEPPHRSPLKKRRFSK
jgi:hypothetical protein